MLPGAAVGNGSLQRPSRTAVIEHFVNPYTLQSEYPFNKMSMSLTLYILAYERINYTQQYGRLILNYATVNSILQT